MPLVSDLLRTGSRLPIRLLAGPAQGRPLSMVTAVESLQELSHAPRGTLAVVTGRAAGHAPDYQMDVAVRQAAERTLAAVVLVGRHSLPITAVRLAERAGLAVLTAPAEWDVADLVLHIDRIIRGGAADAIARAQAALAAIRESEPAGSEEDLLARVTIALAREVTWTDGPGEPVSVDGRLLGELAGPPDDAVDLVLPAVAAALSRMRAATLAREMAPGQTRAEVITELIIAERMQAGRMAERARGLGFPVDGLHTVVWIRADGSDLAEHRRLYDTLTLHVHQVLPSWNLARVADDILIVRSDRRDVPAADIRSTAESLIRVVVTGEHPRSGMRCGIGTGQQGLDGLRQSAMEARAAASVAARDLTSIHVFDATGIGRILAEVAASALSSRVVDDLLGPLDSLGSDRATEALTTLCAYLDTRGSLKATARLLHIHPNTVTYRLRQITERLGADLTDADLSFALHLACRVRLGGRSEAIPAAVRVSDRR
jgi:sugar diacid utilization regulator